jgi:hypothetical protein
MGRRTFHGDGSLTGHEGEVHLALIGGGAIIRGEFTAGAMSFDSLGSKRTRMTVQVNFEPHGVTKKVGEMLAVVSYRVEVDLLSLKI